MRPLLILILLDIVGNDEVLSILKAEELWDSADQKNQIYSLLNKFIRKQVKYYGTPDPVSIYDKRKLIRSQV
ncbi:MAG: hypothetical protein ACTHKF_08085 [Candidatus Nitrosocosmicus sp.]